MTELAAALRKAGRRIITLSQGELDFDTPPNICDAAVRAIHDGKTRYTPVAGTDELREAIRHKLLRDQGLTYGADEITVGCGAKQVIFNALFATVSPGDEVVIPAPCWVSYTEMVRLVGGRPVVIGCSEGHGFKLRAEALEGAITPRTKWLILNSPANPTGAVYRTDELRELADVLEGYPRLWVLSDDIYERLVYGAARFATMAQVAPGLRRRTLTVNGVSKSHAMTGWRVGYGAGPAELIRVMNTIQGHTSSHTSSVSQCAAVEAMLGDDAFARATRRALQERRDLVVGRIGGIDGLRCGTPDGAFYVFASCVDLIGRTTPAGRRLETDSDVVMFFLENAGVAVVAGAAFMASPYVRLSYAATIADLDAACDRIAASCAALHAPAS